MDSDKKTTVFGIVKGIIVILISAIVYFTGIPIDNIQTGVTSATDWISLLGVVFGIVTAVLGYYTNKPKVQMKKEALIVNYKLNKSQKAFINSENKFTAFTSGYKGGKTYSFARKAVKLLIQTKADGLLAEPTYRMNTDILIPELEKALKEVYIPYNFMKSDYLFLTKYGKILIRTQEKRASLEGHSNLGWAGFDEVDLIDKEDAEINFTTIISKLLKGDKRYFFCSGTNEGYHWIYNKFKKDSIYNEQTNTYIKDVDGFKLELIQGSTYDNNENLPKDYIESLKANYTEQQVKRYIYGEFVNLENGIAYESFSNDNILAKEFNKYLETYVCWDFNATSMPMATCIVQKQLDGTYHVIKEFINKFTNTGTQTKIVNEYLLNNKLQAPLFVTGDSAGNRHESNAALTDYQIILNSFKNTDLQGCYKSLLIRPTLSIKDRVHSLNALFNNYLGKKRLFINPDCIWLINDLRQVSWLTDKYKLDGRNSDLTHISDALSYFAYNVNPLIEI